MRLCGLSELPYKSVQLSSLLFDAKGFSWLMVIWQMYASLVFQSAQKNLDEGYLLLFFYVYLFILQ